MLTVVIPWRPQPSREPAFSSVVSWYRQTVPEARIVTVDSRDPVFNLAQCRNDGMRAVEPGSVAIIGDADTIPEAGALREAIAAAATSGLVHLPYDEYRWLGPVGDAQYRSGVPLEECSFELVRGACSGVYVATPEAWAQHGGQDERFRGWGFEDAAWYLAHETLLGEPPRRHEGRVFALHHVPEKREGPQYEANAALMARYREASGDPVAMLDLVSADRARSLPGV